MRAVNIILGYNGIIMMTTNKLEYFQELLLERLGGLLDGANKTVIDMTVQGDSFPDPTDRASLESDRNFELRIRDRERQLIVKIEEALNRIKTKSFGICEECGEDISTERLTARPVTTLCINCKKNQENRERRQGK